MTNNIIFNTILKNICALQNCLEIKQLYRDGVHLYGRTDPRTPIKIRSNNTILIQYIIHICIDCANYYYNFLLSKEPNEKITICWLKNTFKICIICK